MPPYGPPYNDVLAINHQVAAKNAGNSPNSYHKSQKHHNTYPTDDHKVRHNNLQSSNDDGYFDDYKVKENKKEEIANKRQVPILPKVTPTPGSVGYQQIVFHGVETYYDIPKDGKSSSKEPKSEIELKEPKLATPSAKPQNGNGKNKGRKKPGKTKKSVKDKPVGITRTTRKPHARYEFWKAPVKPDFIKVVPNTTPHPAKYPAKNLPIKPNHGFIRQNKHSPYHHGRPLEHVHPLPPALPVIRDDLSPVQPFRFQKVTTTLPPLAISALPRLIKHTAVIHKNYENPPFLASTSPATYLVNPTTTVSTLRHVKNASKAPKSIKVTTAVPAHLHVTVTSHGDDEINIQAYPVPPIPTYPPYPPSPPRPTVTPAVPITLVTTTKPLRVLSEVLFGTVTETKPPFLRQSLSQIPHPVLEAEPHPPPTRAKTPPRSPLFRNHFEVVQKPHRPIFVDVKTSYKTRPPVVLEVVPVHPVVPEVPVHPVILEVPNVHAVPTGAPVIDAVPAHPPNSVVFRGRPKPTTRIPIHVAKYHIPVTKPTKPALSYHDYVPKVPVTRYPIPVTKPPVKVSYPVPVTKPPPPVAKKPYLSIAQQYYPVKVTHPLVTHAPVPVNPVSVHPVPAYSVPSTHPPVPVTHPPVPITHSPVPVTHPPVPRTHPPVPLTHPPVPVTHPPVPVTHPPVPVTHPPVPTSHHLVPTSHHPVPTSHHPVPGYHVPFTRHPTPARHPVFHEDHLIDPVHSLPSTHNHLVSNIKDIVIDGFKTHQAHQLPSRPNVLDLPIQHDPPISSLPPRVRRPFRSTPEPKKQKDYGYTKTKKPKDYGYRKPKKPIDFGYKKPKKSTRDYKTVPLQKPFRLSLDVKDEESGATRKLRDYGIYQAKNRNDDDSNQSGSENLPLIYTDKNEIIEGSDEDALIAEAQQHMFDKMW